MKIGFLKSIRFRLAAWYATAFLVATIIIFSSFYLMTSQALYKQNDSTLTAYGSRILNTMVPNTSLEQAVGTSGMNQELSNMPGVISVVMNSNGEIIGGALARYYHFEAIDGLYKKSTEEVDPFFENNQIGNLRIRFLVYPIRNNGNFQGTIILGQSVEVIEKSLDTLLWEMIFVLLALMIPGIIGGYAIARSAMKPITDISQKLGRIDYKNMKERLVDPKTDDELEELVLSFNQLLDRLSDAFNRERQFIGDVAHELKTPLSVLKSRIEIVLSKDREKQDYKKEFIEVLADVDRLSFLLQDILDLAWSESDRAKMDRKKLDLSALTEELKELSVSMASTKKISIISRINERIFIIGKQDKIFRALLNLVDNAIKYTGKNGVVEISLFKEKKNAVFFVRDSGNGIPSDELPNIFNRFFRGKSNNNVSGSGLGLAIARAIVAAHGGRIEVRSKLHKGSTFKVFLPLR